MKIRLKKKKKRKLEKSKSLIWHHLQVELKKNSSRGIAILWTLLFKLYNVNSSSQKSHKQHFIMLFPNLGNKQHKVNKHIFAKGPSYSFQTFYKYKTTLFLFCFLLLQFSFSFFYKIFYFRHHYATWHLDSIDTSSNKNHMSSHEKGIIKK